MAKSEKEYSVPEKLANLYKLQLYVSQIDKIKSLRGELPQEVADMEAEIDTLNTRLGKFSTERENCTNKIAELQGKIAESEALIAQYTAQQDDVRNNKEYEFLSKEIEYQKLEIELSNKRINENLAAIEELKTRETDAQTELDERRGELDIKKGELDEIIAETRSEEETLREKAKKLENTIDTQLLSTFKRIHKKAHNGLAIAPITDGACGGCHNKLAPQRQIDVKTRRKILFCEYCGRILIDEELANENRPRARKGVLNGY